MLGLTGFPPEAARAALGDAERVVAHFAGVFARLDCDVLALQEGPSVETIRRIAERLEMHLASFPSPTAYPGYILSRHPLQESRAYAHPGPGARDGPFSRHAGAARLNAAGREVWVMDVHLHPVDRDMRRNETDRLAGHLAALGTEHALTMVVGDFNSLVGEPVHEMLAARGFVNAMVRVRGAIAATVDTAGVGPTALDHVYVSPPLAGRLTSARVVRDPGFRVDDPAPAGAWVHSDHLPVLADLELP